MKTNNHKVWKFSKMMKQRKRVNTRIASMSSSGESFLPSRRAFFSSALAVFLSVFSFPLPAFFVFFPILFLLGASIYCLQTPEWRLRRKILRLQWKQPFSSEGKTKTRQIPTPVRRGPFIEGNLYKKN